MSKKQYLTAEQKVSIIREHLLEKIPISDLCDKHNIHATQFYTWQKQLFENGAGWLGSAKKICLASYLQALVGEWGSLSLARKNGRT